MFSRTNFDKREKLVGSLFILICFFAILSSCANISSSINFDTNNQQKEIVSDSSNPTINSPSSPVNYSLTSNWVRRQYTSTNDVEVVDDIAYIADEKAFILYNLSNLVNPQLISIVPYPTGRYIEKVEIEGDFAFLGIKDDEYIEEFNAIDIFNISNPEEPLHLSIFFNYYIVDFCAHGNYLYITTLHDGLLIIDITNPSLDILSTWGKTNYNSYLNVSGNYLFFVDADELLIILDITNKAAPIEIFNGLSFETVLAIYLEENFLYLLGEHTLTIVSLFTITNPEIVWIIDLYAITLSYYFEKQLSIRNNICYLLNDIGLIFVIDISTPENPHYFNLVYSNFQIQAFSWLEDNLIATNGVGLVIFDLSDSTKEIVLFEDEYSITNKLNVEGQIAIVCDTSNGILLFNISNIGEPILLSNFVTGTRVYAAVLQNDLAIIVDTISLYILNISNPISPVVLGTLVLPDINQLTVQGDYVYAVGRDKFEIIDISTPSTPFKTDGFYLSYWMREVVVQDDLAVITASFGIDVILLNISDKYDIQILVVFNENEGRCYDINVVNDLLFIATIEGLKIYNISVTSDPTFITTLNSSDFNIVTRIHIDNNLLYCTTTTFPVIIFNISNIEDISLYGKIFPSEDTDWLYANTNDYFDLVAANETIYVASEQGFSIFSNDTDSDNVPDYLELEVHSTDPLDFDSDDDEMSDGFEIQHNMDPNNAADSSEDYDLDGLSNLEESYYLTNPLVGDTDFDGLFDFDEITYGTNPLLIDTDYDKLLDGFEIVYLFSNPLDNDTDNDSLVDWDEFYIYRTNLNSNDTDNDFISDDYEIRNHLNPLNATDRNSDLDLDGLSNYEEFILGTDACNSDTDGDTFSDFEEQQQGTDPLDYFDHPSETEEPLPYPSHNAGSSSLESFFFAVIFLVIIPIGTKRRRNK